MTIRDQLQAVRDALGKPVPLVGRKWGKIDPRDLIPARGPTGDPLDGFWKDQSTLLKSGQVVWAALIQANHMLFEPGQRTLPGEVVADREENLDSDPEPLLLCAQRISELKGTVPTDPQLRVVAERITNEMHRSLAERLPASITDDEELVRHTVYFHQPHLPHGVLNGNLLPLLVHPSSRYAMVVPYWYWPGELVAEWEPREEQMEEYRQKDEARANRPFVQITPVAMRMLRQLIAEHQQPGETLRVRLSPSGLDLDPNRCESDLEVMVNGLAVVVDRESVEQCRGSTIDFVDYGKQRGFSVSR